MMKKWIPALLLSCFLLNACAPIIFVAGAAAGGAIVYDRGALKDGYIDSEIDRRALTALRHSPELAGKSHLTIASFHGIVLLLGQVQAPELKDIAYNLVKNIPHVKRVYNEITIAGSSSFMTRTNDGWITMKVKTNMLREHGLKSSSIKVVTENGVVYLMGQVTPVQAAIAANVARHVGGVQRVVKVFEYQ